MRSDDLRLQGPKSLLVTYASVMHLLRAHGVIRTFNNPVADIAEWLVSPKLDLTLEGSSAKGFDATDARGQRYQIKGRWLAGRNQSTQLSAIRNLPASPFDFLVAVMFDGNFSVEYGAVIPVATVQEKSTYVPHTNSYRFNFHRSLLLVSGVRDVTAELQVFPPTAEEVRLLNALQSAQSTIGSIS